MASKKYSQSLGSCESRSKGGRPQRSAGSPSSPLPKLIEPPYGSLYMLLVYQARRGLLYTSRRRKFSQTLRELSCARKKSLLPEPDIRSPFIAAVIKRAAFGKFRPLRSRVRLRHVLVGCPYATSEHWYKGRAGHSLSMQPPNPHVELLAEGGAGRGFWVAKAALVP